MRGDAHLHGLELGHPLAEHLRRRRLTEVEHDVGPAGSDLRHAQQRIAEGKDPIPGPRTCFWARGPAAADFSTKGADADLQLTLTFAAYE